MRVFKVSVMQMRNENKFSIFLTTLFAIEWKTTNLTSI